MDDNKNIFTGKVEFAKERRFGSNAWGSISVRIMQACKSFTFRNEQKFISQPQIWMNIKTTYEGDALTAQDAAVLKSCQEGKYIFVTGAKITDFEQAPKDANGKPIENAPKEVRYSLECSPSGLAFASSPFPDINMSILEGYVTETDPNGQIKVKIPYKAKTETKYRSVLVFHSNEFDPSLAKQRVFISGQVFGKTPDPAKKDLIYVVASQVITLRK